MRPNDLLLISSTNLDHLTETYNIGFYMEYLTKWPELCQVIEGMDGKIEGYSTFTPLLDPWLKVLRMLTTRQQS
jgi:ribosomal protein S18 acetylase RimI-like enzyme